MSRNFPGLLLAAALFFLLTGCCGCNRADWPASPALGHMDINQKLAYMENVQQTLAVFRTSLADIEQHSPQPAPDEDLVCDDDQYSCQVYKFVEVYAMPIITDEGAQANLQTRREVAQINLLSAYAFYQIKQYGRARTLVNLFEKQYGEDPSILDSPMDSRDLGFSTFAEGLRLLKRKLLVG